MCNSHLGLYTFPNLQKSRFRTALGANPMSKSACHLCNFFAILKRVSKKRSCPTLQSVSAHTLACAEWNHCTAAHNVNAVLGPWVPSHRLGDPIHKRAAYQKQRSQKIPPALCRCSKCPPALPYDFRHAGTSGTVARAAGRVWGVATGSGRERHNPCL